MGSPLGGRRHLPLRPVQAARARSTRSTPRRRPSPAPCTSATSSPTPTPTRSPASSGCAGVRSSTRWAGTTTACPPSAGCRTTSACAATRRCPTTPTSTPPAKPDPKRQVADLAAQLHRAVRAAHRRGREGVRGAVAPARAVGRLVADLRHHRRRRAGRLAAGVPAQPGARRGLPGRGAHAVGRHLPHRRRPGRAGGPGVAGRLPPDRRFHRPSERRPVWIETTRPELMPACVALVAHPDDERYQPLFGTHGR